MGRQLRDDDLGQAVASWNVDVAGNQGAIRINHDFDNAAARGFLILRRFFGPRTTEKPTPERVTTPAMAAPTNNHLRMISSLKGNGRHIIVDAVARRQDLAVPQARFGRATSSKRTAESRLSLLPVSGVSRIDRVWHRVGLSGGAKAIIRGSG